MVLRELLPPKGIKNINNSFKYNASPGSDGFNYLLVKTIQDEILCYKCCSFWLIFTLCLYFGQ